MSENLTPFEHRLLNALDRIATHLGDVSTSIDELRDEIYKGLGDSAQRTLDQMG